MLSERREDYIDEQDMRKNIWRKNLVGIIRQPINKIVLTGILAGADSVDVCIASIAHVGDLW